MDIQKVLRLDATQYYQDMVPKRQIYLHHTVGGSAKSTVDYWNKTPERIGTAYIVERDGTIFEVFPPRILGPPSRAEGSAQQTSQHGIDRD